MADKRAYGPNASRHFALLNEEQQELFAWFTDKLVNGNTLRYSSMLQAIACWYPRANYWDLVRAVKEIASKPSFEEDMRAAEVEAARTMRTPPEA